MKLIIFNRFHALIPVSISNRIHAIRGGSLNRHC